MADRLTGPFEVLHPLASGGLSDVFVAQHGPTGQKVALKVLREDARPFWESIEHEVRAAAALDHPNLVRLYDSGVVPQDGEGFVAGAPWVAMELCAEGSLRRRSRSLDWAQARHVLLQLLDGLAHAHGRGVLHRDVKAANVVFDEDRAVLTDFGLAYYQVGHLEGEGGVPLRGGTPSYIAPEQIRGHWHRQGPWTDLYALGAMAWTMLTGVAPYRGSRDDKLRAHLKGELPDFRPRYAVPGGVEPWLRSLLALAPRDRPRSAASARQGLERLGPRVAPRTPTRRPELGLGLVAARHRPLVGRGRAQERLRTLLDEVRESGLGRAVVIEGPSGVGKAALGGWLLEHARATGNAEASRGSYDPGPGRRAGLAQALAGLVRAPAGAHEVLVERATGWLEEHDGDPLDAIGIAQVVAPRPEVRQVETPAARFALARRVMSLGGPAVVVLEQAHWGVEAFRFARNIADAPILLVLTYDPDRAGDVERNARRALQAETLSLSALEDPAELVEALGLRPGIALPGHPLFAVETVRWWLQRGLLQTGPEGLEVAADAPTPVDLSELWRRRCEAVWAERSSWRGPLELLAVLGVEVELRVWREACVRAGLDPAGALLRALDASGLARVAQGHVRLAHPTLRQALLEGCGDLDALHAAAAEASWDPAVQGRHLLAAGRLEDALEPLFEASELARRRGEYDASEQLLGLYDRALRSQPASDARWGEGWVRRSTLCQVKKDVAGMELWAGQALESAQIHTWVVVEASARLKLSAAHRLRGRLTEAWNEAKIAGSLAEHLDDASLRDRVIYEKIQVTARLGRLEDSLLLSRRYLENSQRRLTPSGSIARAWLLVASAHARLEEHEATLEALDAAGDAARRSGERFILASCAVVRGELLRKRGDPEAAIPHYREAERTLDLLGHGDADIARLNLACCELDLGGRPEALARKLLAVEAGVLLAMGARVCLLPCVADRPDGEAERLLEALEGSTVTDADFARYAELAAERAVGDRRRQRLLAYAKKQRARLAK